MRDFQADGTTLVKPWRWEAPGMGGKRLQCCGSCRATAGAEQVGTRQEDLDYRTEKGGLIPYSVVAGFKFWRDVIRFAI